MRLQDIVSMLGDYFRLGIVLFSVVFVALLVGYWGIYKKMCKGKRQVDIKRVFWWIILVFYLFVVMSVTLLRRYGGWNGQIISFFYSYKDAWITASETAWRNIILNILMFVPLGFWLPFGQKRFRVSWKTYLVGFFLTVGIECIQLALSLGLFEVADLFNNTLGTMIGYGLYKIGEYIVLSYKKEMPKFVSVVVCQIPLLLTVGMFTAIFVAYEKQELGNLSIECISPYSDDEFTIISNEEYSVSNKTVMVYQTNTLTVEETEEFARNYFENLGTTLDESRNDIYENTAVYWAEDSYSMWVEYEGGTFSMTDFDTTFPEEGTKEPQQVTNATEETIRNALYEYGIEIPDKAIFSYAPNTGYVLTVKMVEDQGVILDGELRCDYYDNGKFADIKNNIVRFEAYKEFEIISEKEAFEQILAGKFVGFVSSGSQIEVEQVYLEYMLDTKGFYQPVYSFSVRGSEMPIQIPAINNAI